MELGAAAGQRSHVVLHYTGHRVLGASGADERAERRVAEAIGQVLDGLDVAGACGSLASGADILFAEALLARNIPLRVFLPFAAERFAATSVRPAGGAWEARFRAILPRLADVTTLPGAGSDSEAYATCARAAMAAALAVARDQGAAPLQLAVWNGVAARGQAGTAADVRAWAAMGLPSRTIGVG